MPASYSERHALAENLTNQSADHCDFLPTGSIATLDLAYNMHVVWLHMHGSFHPVQKRAFPKQFAAPDTHFVYAETQHLALLSSDQVRHLVPFVSPISVKELIRNEIAADVTNYTPF